MVGHILWIEHETFSKWSINLSDLLIDQNIHLSKLKIYSTFELNV